MVGMKICGPPAADVLTFRGVEAPLAQHDATRAPGRGPLLPVSESISCPLLKGN